MKYYRINNSIDFKEVGIFPQIQDTISSFDLYQINSAYHLFYEFADDNILWPDCKLSSKAKITDLLSVSTMPFAGKLIISTSLKNIIEDYTNDGIQFIQINLMSNGGTNSYWVVNPFWPKFDCINISASKFVYTDPLGSTELSDANFNSFDQYKSEFLNNHKRAPILEFKHTPLVLTKMVVKESCNTDFFSMIGVKGGIGFYTSERLMNKIKEEKISGIEFSEL